MTTPRLLIALAIFATGATLCPVSRARGEGLIQAEPDRDPCAAGPQVDCNGNSIIDACEIAWGYGTDCNSNGTLDICELDAPGVRINATDAAQDDFFADAVGAHGNVVIIGAAGNDDGGPSSGCAYVFRPVPWYQAAKLTATDAAAGDAFGSSVAVDGTTAVIGAIGDSDLGMSSGSVYVFREMGGTWQQIAKLTASDGTIDDEFGFSVGISGSSIIVGSPWHSDGAYGTGAAYVFQEVQGVWQQVAKLTAADAAQSDFFGYSVAIDGDTAVVGAFRDDDQASGTGSAYVFRESGGTWQQVDKLHAADASGADLFGVSVAINSSFAVIGAEFATNGWADSGAAYVFWKNAEGIWTQFAKLVPTDSYSSDRFGRSVAIADDTIVAGSENHDEAAPDAGAAYVFRLTDGSWVQIAKVTAPDAAATDRYGSSVALAGETAIIGAPFDDAHGTLSGSAYAHYVGVQATDCNGNWIPDDCDIVYHPQADCNADGLLDACTQRGDVNADGVVGLSDHALLADCLLGPGGALSASCCLADLDGDDDADLADFAELQILLGHQQQ